MKYNWKKVTIGAGASLSDAADLRNVGNLAGIVTASTWDTAAISLAVSYDNVTFLPLHYQGAEWKELAVAANMAVTLDPAIAFPWPFVKIQSGLSTAAVNQADATILTLILVAV